jgi:hypothetical protein
LDKAVHIKLDPELELKETQASKYISNQMIKKTEKIDRSFGQEENPLDEL